MNTKRKTKAERIVETLKKQYSQDELRYSNDMMRYQAQAERILNWSNHERGHYEGFRNFLIAAWSEFETEPLIMNWSHTYLCEVLERELWRITYGEPKTKDFVINQMFRSLKSKQICVYFNAYAWLINPSLKFIYVTHSDMLAFSFSSETRNLIQSRWYQLLFGHIYRLQRDQNSKTLFVNNKRGERLSIGVGGKIRGFGGNFLILDDINKSGTGLIGESESERNYKNAWYQAFAHSRINQPDIDVRINVQQRVHENDLSGFMLKNYDVHHINIPGEIGRNNEYAHLVSPPELVNEYVDGLFFPERFSWKTLDELRNAIGSYLYAAQVLQSPAPIGGGIIKAKWFKTFYMQDLPSSEHITWNFKADTAYTERKSNSASCVIAYCIWQNTVYIRNIMRVWQEFPDFLNSLTNFVIENGYTDKSRIYIEPKANGISVIQSIRKFTRLNVVEERIEPTSVYADFYSKDKIARVTTILPILEAERVRLLANAGFIKEFINELTLFPNSQHQDQVDTLVMIARELLYEQHIAVAEPTRAFNDYFAGVTKRYGY